MIFLKLVHAGEPVRGEATAFGYVGQIVLSSFSWILEATGPPQPPRRYAPLDPKDVRLEKTFDLSSTALYRRMDDWGRKNDRREPMYDLAVITIVDPSTDEAMGKAEPMLTVTLKQCNLKSINTAASEGGRSMRLTESLVLSFEEGSLAYRPFHPQHAGRRLPPKTFTLPPESERRA